MSKLAFWCAIFTALILFTAMGGASSTNSFIQMLERREGVAPGQTKVIPECGCTVRYLGTRVHGRIYTVELEKLD